MLRKVEQLVENNWKLTEMKNLLIGDVFRMFEPDSGEQVGDKWIATSNAKIIDGVWGVEAEEYV